jgi:ribonuclease HI
MEQEKIIECYTDASYSTQANGSVIGYKIGDNQIVIDFLPEVKNTQAELIAVNNCIKYCQESYPGNQIHIYTDCQKAVRLDYGENVIMHKMIGHIKKDLRDDKQKIFALVDKETRKELRRIHKQRSEVKHDIIDGQN